MKDRSEAEEEELFNKDDPEEVDFFDSEDEGPEDFEISNPGVSESDGTDDFEAGDPEEDFDIGSADVFETGEPEDPEIGGADDFEAGEPEDPDIGSAGAFEAGDPEESGIHRRERDYFDEDPGEETFDGDFSAAEYEDWENVSYDESAEPEEGPDVFAPEKITAPEKDKTPKGIGGLFGGSGKKIPVKRIAVMFAAGAACALLIFGIVAAVLNSQKKKSAEKPAEEQAEQIVLEKQQVSNVRFLSFGPLSLKNKDGYVSVKEFSQILDMLYDESYVLVDIYSIGRTDENGSMILNGTIDVPEGKTPLVLMQRDVSYPIDRQTEDFARKLVVDAEGFVRSEYMEDEQGAIGDCDLIPILETFIREHPDFSYNGARGIIGLTGYNGILGYRTSPYLKSEEDNPYGTFDTDNQTQAMQAVLEKLQENGWRFASNGFGSRISYGSEYSLVEKDAVSWKDQVGSLIGGTDILMFPRQTDIGSWAPYDENNTKYTLMRGMGFRIYLAADDETPGFMLAKNEYLRIAVTDINTYNDFEAAFSDSSEEETAA